MYFQKFKKKLSSTLTSGRRISTVFRQHQKKKNNNISLIKIRNFWFNDNFVFLFSKCYSSINIKRCIKFTNLYWYIFCFNTFYFFISIFIFLFFYYVGCGNIIKLIHMYNVWTYSYIKLNFFLNNLKLRVIYLMLEKGYINYFITVRSHDKLICNSCTEDNWLWKNVYFILKISCLKLFFNI